MRGFPTAVTYASIETLIFDAHEAYNILRCTPGRSPAIDEAQDLMADIATAAAMVRFPERAPRALQRVRVGPRSKMVR
jgi:hypothetical protein